MLCMKHLIEWQGFSVKLNIIYQDNTSSIKLEHNGKESLGGEMGNLHDWVFSQNEVKI